MTVEDVRQMALSFKDSEEKPHFERPSFRVKNKIFATVDLKNGHAVLKLTEVEQSVYQTAAPTNVFPVEGKWGRQGWTVFVLENLDPDLFSEALKFAFCQVAPKKLAQLYQTPDTN